jgi:exoribonuclease R
MAAFSSQASVAFNTYLYFKSLQSKGDCLQTAVVMRVTQGGVYVMVQKYGIEGLLVIEGTVRCIPEKETAVINGKDVKVFDRV